MKEIKETKLNVLTQGNIKLLHDHGHRVKNNDHVVCFYIDTVARCYVDSSGVSESDCPVVHLSTGVDIDKTITDVEFSDFPGWRVLCAGNGESVAVALVKD